MSHPDDETTERRGATIPDDAYDRDFDGVIETADPETGAPELLGYWLPAAAGIADHERGGP